VHAFELRSAADLIDGLLDNPAPPLLRLHVECGSGTYVRSLVRDLGEALGCGAHVAQLRRLWVDPFRDPRMWTLQDLETLASRGEHSLDACLLPVEQGMVAWPGVEIAASQVARLGHGQGLAGPFRPAGQVAIFDPTGRALGLGEVDAAGRLQPLRLFAWACAQRPGTIPAAS
jgi:tRNA pseudouridine55 synthase